MKRTLLLTIAATGLLPVGMHAQAPQPAPYLMVACVKVTPGKSTEYRQFVTDTSKKIAEVRAQDGEILSWTLGRSVLPAGTEARCDYTIATTYPGIPPTNNDTAGLSKSIDKAGIKMTAAQYLAKRDALSHLVSLEMWRARVRVGNMEKGNYYFVNHMHVHKSADYIKFETEIWRPLAEEWIKEGTQTGWRFNTLVMPSGTDVKYTALSVDIYPTFEAAFKRRRTAETFKKVHAGKDYEQTMGGISGLRDLAMRDLMYAQEVVNRK